MKRILFAQMICGLLFLGLTSCDEKKEDPADQAEALAAVDIEVKPAQQPAAQPIQPGGMGQAEPTQVSVAAPAPKEESSPEAPQPPPPDTEAPDAPTELSHLLTTLAADTSPMVSWMASTSPDTVSYEVAIGGETDATSLLSWQTVSGTSFQATGLSLGSCSSNYLFSVRAADQAGNKSDVLKSSVGFYFDAIPPSKPTSLVQLGDANEIGGETTSWTAAADDCSFVSYQMAVSTTQDESAFVTGGGWKTVGTELQGRLETGLSLVPFTTYYTLVRAVDLAGNVSAFEASGGWTIPGPPYGVTNLTIGSRTTNSIEIAWTKPGDNGSPITDYYVEFRLTSASEWSVFDDGVGTGLHTTVTGLTDNTSYTFRVRAYNGTTGDYSNEAVGETLLDIPFFEPDVFKIMNNGGATESSVVAFEDNTTVSIEGTDHVLQAGDTYEFTSTVNQVIEADKPIFAAGRKGSSGASANQKGNMVWGTKDWSGKEFLFTGSRDAPHIISVYAFENADVTIYQGGTPVSGASASLDVATNPQHTFSIPNNGAFHIVSTGLIVAHMHSNASNRITDPKPLLPIGKDIIGFPSKSARVSSLSSANNYTVYHSNGTTSAGTLTAGTEKTISPLGSNTALYQSYATRVVADNEIVANSHADSNGYCSAPYIPISLMRKRYAINVAVDYVAFASLETGTINVIQPNGTTSTLTLTRSGSEANAPYAARIVNMPKGTRFEADVRMGAWYQPNSDAYGSDEDETIMFGYD